MHVRILSLVSATISDAFPAVILDAAAKACVIFLLAALAAVMLRRSSAATRHLVWGIAFLAFFLSPILSGAVPQWRVLPDWLGAEAIIPAIGGAGTPAARRPSLVDRGDAGRLDRSRRAVEVSARSGVDAPGSSEFASGETPSTSPSGLLDLATPARIVIIGWSIGFGLMVLRAAFSRLILRRVLLTADPIEDGPIGDEIGLVRSQFGIGRHVHAYLSPRRGTPMTWGLLRTYLLLPAGATGWGPRRLRSVVLHELAHVKHFDTISHVLTQGICALYWFHPLVWVALRRLRIERERACDDLVLRNGVRASDYAEDLLGLLVPRAIPSAALGIAGRSELEVRLRAILDETVDRRSISVKVLILALTVGATSTTALAVLRASDRPESGPGATQTAKSEPSAARLPQKPGPGVNILCVDAGGRPVAGAEVHLFQLTAGAAGRYIDSGPLVTDAQGSASCADAIFNNDLGNFDRWIYARVAGRLVGVARSAKWTNRTAFNLENRVVLQASRTVEGRVTVPEGFDPTKVTVRVRTLHVIKGPGDMDYESFPREAQFPGLDSALPQIFEAHPDAGGTIRFGDVPQAGRLFLITAGDGLAEAQWWNGVKGFAQPIELTILEESILSGRVTAPDGKAAAGMDVAARLSPDGGTQIPYLSTFKAVTDAEGEFTIRGLPQTEFDLSIRDPMDRLAFRPLEKLIVQPRQDPGLSLKLEVGIRVTGRVVDPEGRPIQNAGISAVGDGQVGRGLDDEGTDGDGRYQMLLPPGVARMYFNGLPEGFEYPDPQVMKKLDLEPGQAEVTNLDFTLRRRADPAP